MGDRYFEDVVGGGYQDRIRAASTWTKDKPTQPGYYWYRTEARNAEPVMIEREDYDGQLWMHSFGVSCGRLIKYDGEWQGPLEVPR